MPEKDNFSITTFLPELYGGTFEAQITNALKEAALAVAAHESGKVKGKVAIEFSLQRISESRQLTVEHKLKYEYPTTKGKRSEELATATPVYCGNRGALTIAPESQIPMFDRD